MKLLGTRSVLNETLRGENVMVCNDQRLFEKKRMFLEPRVPEVPEYVSVDTSVLQLGRNKSTCSVYSFSLRSSTSSLMNEYAQ